jgi:hypothetical protein
MLSVAAFAVAPSAYAQRSAQDVAQARVLFNDGMDLKEKGDLKGALEKFKAAHALGNTPLTGIELCKAHQALHQPVEAREACLSVARIGPIPEESQRSKDARGEAAKIAEVEKPKMGSIKVKVVGAPAGTTPTVSIDGVQIPSAALDVPRPVDPGSHVILASVGNGGQTKATLETKEGENREVEVPVQPPAAGEPTTPPPTSGQAGPTGPAPPPKKKGNTFGTVMLGLGGTAALIGLIGGGVALSKKGDLDDACTDNICGRKDWSTLDSASTWGTVSTVSFVAAGLFLGIGAITILASSSSSHGAAPKKSNVGLTLRGLDGTF